MNGPRPQNKIALGAGGGEMEELDLKHDLFYRLSMTQVNLNEVKSRLAHYVRRVKAGETLILCDRDKPFAEIRPWSDPGEPRPKRELGLMKGWFPVPENFNEPDSEVEDAIENIR